MKTRAELIAMTDQELSDYEQSLLAQWTPEMAIKNQLYTLTTEHTAQVEIFRKLKDPFDLKNIRLVNSIKSLKCRIKNLENKLNDLTQNTRAD